MPYRVPPVVSAGRLSSRPQPSLKAGRLLLRPWGERDVDALVAAFGDEAIQQWHARTVESPREALELINEWNARWSAEAAARWVVVDIAGDEVVGQVGLRSIDFAEGEADISYWVVPQSRQRGVATESVSALAGWAFDDLGLHRLELHHSPLNAASCRLAAKTGFVLEGTMREKALHTDGWHDMHLHARLRHESEPGRAAPSKQRVTSTAVRSQGPMNGS